MYGTVFTFRAKEGKAGEVKRLVGDWIMKRQPGVAGAQAGYLYQLDSDPNEFVGVSVFADKKAYFANADSGEQDAWFKELRANIEADPKWMDGEVLGH